VEDRDARRRRAPSSGGQRTHHSAHEVNG
jgi:hypothetical protein